MIKLNKREEDVLLISIRKDYMSSSEMHSELKKKEDLSLVTVKRTLSEMTEKGLLDVVGSGRSTKYKISVWGRVFSEVDSSAYISIEPDKRYGLKGYNFNLFPSFPQEIFTEDELKKLEHFTLQYKEKVNNLSSTIKKKELERLTIEFSWKSSKIEGNTYTLLDTEKLILENKEAEGKTKEETQMILNHKDALYFVYENKDDFKKFTRAKLEEVHKLIVKDLGVSLGLRKSPVGISGSLYRPLDNGYQIEEALNTLIETINRFSNPYTKAVVTLLGISYIQPFEDGNKRTARIIADALLMAENHAPLSYRSVDEKEYKEATLAFYELNSVMPFKKIFIDQYKFSAENYAIA